MHTPKDNHSVTSSPLMTLEFLIIHTIIGGFLLCILFYLLDLLLTSLFYMPQSNALYRFLYMPPFSYLRQLFVWPGVMLTALVITGVRCILRRTTVTLSGNTVTISRLRHTDRLFLTDFVRQKTVESYIGFQFIGWVFRRRYLIFLNDAGKEVKYRLYEYSEKDLERVMQLLTRISYTEQLDEADKTEIIIDAFQYESELRIDPRHLWRCMARRPAILSLLSAAVFGASLYLFYRMLTIPPQYDTGSSLQKIAGYGSITAALISLYVLCRALWALILNAALKSACPQKIAFTGNMLQIDHTMYNANRIRQVMMNSPAGKLPLFGHYEITLITMEGTQKYWLGNTSGFGSGNWATLCRHMQRMLISSPAKLTYR